MRNLVRASTAQRLKKLEAELRHVLRKSKNADAIHDLRVSIRRLRQALRVFRPWFEADRVKKIRRRLRRLLDRCAAVRNCDIAVEVLQAARWKNAELIAALDRERRRTRRELDRELERWNKTDRVQKWREQLRAAHSGSQGTTQETARVLLPAMAEDLFRAGKEAARPNSTHRRMHRLRLKAKRVRYTLELFEPVYGTATKRIMDSLKGLQERLGAINDCATTVEMIRGDRAAAAAVLGLAAQREAEFRKYWNTHFGPRERVRWKAVLGAADRKK